MKLPQFSDENNCHADNASSRTNPFKFGFKIGGIKIEFHIYDNSKLKYLDSSHPKFRLFVLLTHTDWPIFSYRNSRAVNAFTQASVLGDLVKPITSSLNKVRFSPHLFSAIRIEDFITFGVHRHLQVNLSLREMEQQLMHCGDSQLPPVARSTSIDGWLLLSGALL